MLGSGDVGNLCQFNTTGERRHAYNHSGEGGMVAFDGLTRVLAYAALIVSSSSST